MYSFSGFQRDYRTQLVEREQQLYELWPSDTRPVHLQSSTRHEMARGMSKMCRVSHKVARELDLFYKERQALLQS